MSKSCFADMKQKRLRRTAWAASRLSEQEITQVDAAEHIGINARTWRDWVSRGIFPLAHKDSILEVLGLEGPNPSTPDFIWQ